MKKNNRATTCNKMLDVAFGYPKKQVNWTKKDKKILKSLIPEKNKLMRLLKLTS